MKSELIDQYVNLYRQLYWTNDGLRTTELQKMTVKKLNENIQGMKMLIKS